MSEPLTKKEADEVKKAIASSKKKSVKTAGDGKSMDVLSAISALCGKMDGIHKVSDEDDTEFLSTGHMGIDYILSGKWIGGGVPRRKLIECFGPAASAKTAMMYLLCAACQRIGGIAAIIDVEGGRNKEFMEKLGIDISKLLLLEPTYENQACYTIEMCYRKVRDFVTHIRSLGFDGPLFIGIDSIAAVPSFQEWKDAVLDGKSVKEDQGRRAKIIGTWQRTLNSMLRSSDTTLMVLNQIRERVGVMFGPTEITTSGRSTEFYSDCRIEIRRRKTIKRTTFKAADSSGDEKKEKGLVRKLGGFFRVSCEKSRQTAPFRVCENVEIYFEHGIAPLSGIFDLMLLDELAMKSKGAYYSIVDPESRHEAVLSEVENTRFMRKDIEEGDWVYEHPEFFGAESSDEIKAFVAPNATAHRFSLALRKALRDKRAALEDDEEDDDPAESSALKNLKSGGKIVKPKPVDIPVDETGDEEL